MTRIDFHSNVPNKMAYACRLVRKARAAQFRIVLLTRDRSEMAALDQALWTFSEQDFVPHVNAGSPLAEQTPVLLTSAEDDAIPALPHHQILINLSAVRRNTLPASNACLKSFPPMTAIKLRGVIVIVFTRNAVTHSATSSPSDAPPARMNHTPPDNGIPLLTEIIPVTPTPPSTGSQHSQQPAALAPEPPGFNQTGSDQRDVNQTYSNQPDFHQPNFDQPNFNQHFAPNFTPSFNPAFSPDFNLNLPHDLAPQSSYAPPA